VAPHVLVAAGAGRILLGGAGLAAPIASWMSEGDSSNDFTRGTAGPDGTGRGSHPGHGRSPGAALLNNLSNATVNYPFPEGTSITLFAADTAGLFAAGSAFTLTITFADGSSASVSTTIIGP
jgi:hypothetical protein